MAVEMNNIVKKGLSVFSIIILILPFAAYIISFHSYSISENPEDWGTFGSYISGTLAPIISLYTAILLIYITIKLSNKDTKNTRMLRLFDLKQSLYSDIAKTLYMYDSWECSKSKLNIELKLLETKYRNLTFKEKEIEKDRIQQQKEDLQGFFITLNIANLQSINLFINKFPSLYKLYFPLTVNSVEYKFLKDDFLLFVQDVEAIVIKDTSRMDSIRDSSLRKRIDDLLRTLLSEIEALN